MKCEEVRDLLPEHIYGEGSMEEREQVSNHLTSCEVCREEHAHLKQVMGFLDRWEVPDVPEGLADRVLTETSSLGPLVVDRFAGWIGLPGGTLRVGFSAGGGILASVLAVLLVSKVIAGVPLSPKLLVVSGIYWAVAFWVLFLGILIRWRSPWGNMFPAAKAPNPRTICLSVLLAVGVGVLFAYGNSTLGVEPVQLLGTVAPFAPSSILLGCIFFLVGGVFSLVSQFFGVFAAVRGSEGTPFRFGLVAGCVFTMILAPAVSIVCVPFTLGIFASAFTGSLVGAVVGGTLAFRLRRRFFATH